jgi:hypothetical protein
VRDPALFQVVHPFDPVPPKPGIAFDRATSHRRAVISGANGPVNGPLILGKRQIL